MAIKSEIVHLSNHLGVRILNTQWKKMFIHNNNQLPVLVLSKNTRLVIKSKTNSNRAVSPHASGKPYSGGLDIWWNGCLPVTRQTSDERCGLGDDGSRTNGPEHSISATESFIWIPYVLTCDTKLSVSSLSKRTSSTNFCFIVFSESNQ